MNTNDLATLSCDYVKTSDKNRVPRENALSPECIGMRLCDSPLIGFASSKDAYLRELSLAPEANVTLFPPEQWLPGAKTVISLFLPFTSQVRESNRRRDDLPSAPWLHARIEGHALVSALCLYLTEQLHEAGHSALVPVLDPRFATGNYTSNWSERHVAYACGLGTFSLSKGLITSAGVAGRFGSLITDLELPPTGRAYTGLYENCVDCGACARGCPVQAIDPATGKDHAACDAFLETITEKYQPYYGCGKCQCGVPCESRIPQKITR